MHCHWASHPKQASAHSAIWIAIQHPTQASNRLCHSIDMGADITARTSTATNGSITAAEPKTATHPNARAIEDIRAVCFALNLGFTIHLRLPHDSAGWEFEGHVTYLPCRRWRGPACCFRRRRSRRFSGRATNRGSPQGRPSMTPSYAARSMESIQKRRRRVEGLWPPLTRPLLSGLTPVFGLSPEVGALDSSHGARARGTVTRTPIFLCLRAPSGAIERPLRRPLRGLGRQRKGDRSLIVSTGLRTVATINRACGTLVARKPGPAPACGPPFAVRRCRCHSALRISHS